MRQQGGASDTSTLLHIAPGWHPPTHVGGSSIAEYDRRKIIVFATICLHEPPASAGGCVRNFHAIPYHARLAPPNSRWGLFNYRVRLQKKRYPKHHLSSRAPCVSRGVRQALPRHSASRQVGTPQLTLGALELQNSTTEKSLFLSPFAFMSPMRQQGGGVRHFHAIPHRARLAPTNSRWGLLNCRIRTQ